MFDRKAILSRRRREIEEREKWGGSKKFSVWIGAEDENPPAAFIGVEGNMRYDEKLVGPILFYLYTKVSDLGGLVRLA